MTIGRRPRMSPTTCEAVARAYALWNELAAIYTRSLDEASWPEYVRH